MSRKRHPLRGVILVEDQRTERFVRALLRAQGHEPRNFRFEKPPNSRSGSAEDWVRKHFPGEVRVLRSKNFQTNLWLVAVRDGDADGVTRRKRQMDEALEGEGLSPRDTGERICLLVPTWSVETWLLNLLGQEGLDEHQRSPDGREWKHVFQSLEGRSERGALRRAAEAFCDGPTDAWLPSLIDGHEELSRLDE
ncbi:MAG: hypothetical protein H6741_22850 [Alphaproteobacteria bacterium]|nr:hypothetical protein [Alphaproteobacteria bacterium]